jgi:hypothetical protein
MSTLSPSLKATPVTAASPPPAHAPMTVPMGFAGQLRALQEAQREQAERISNLEQENAELRTFKDSMGGVLAQIEELERHNAYLAARRREAVSQLNNLRTLHQEADNAFQMRTSDMQPEDLEGMVCMWGTMVTTAMNHHQRVLGQMRASGQLPAYSTPVPQCQPSIIPVPYRHLYPPAYSHNGYCFAHNMPYCCHICGK